MREEQYLSFVKLNVLLRVIIITVSVCKFYIIQHVVYLKYYHL